MRYRVLLSQGVERLIEADWTEERGGIVFFMRQTPLTDTSIWSESDSDQGGTQVEAISSAEIAELSKQTPVTTLD